MLRSGHSVRFTATEIDAFRQAGFDFSAVRSAADIAQEVSRWAHTLADERLDLLEKIARELAATKGVKLPPRLSAVPAVHSRD